MWLRLRAGCSTSTTCSNGRSWCACAASAHRLAPAPAAPQTSASPDRSIRSASVLTKNPISPSISARVAVRDRRADHHVVLARQPRQQHRPARQQRHEQRRALPLAQRLQPARQLAHPAATRSAPRHSPAAPAAGGPSAAPAAPARPPAARCQYARLPLQHLALQPAAAATPRSPRTAPAAAASGSASPCANAAYSALSSPHQHPHRPAVRDDVVHRHQQHVLVLGQPQQPRRGSAARAPDRTAPRASSRRQRPQLRSAIVCARADHARRSAKPTPRAAIRCTGSPSTHREASCAAPRAAPRSGPAPAAAPPRPAARAAAARRGMW